MIGTWFSLYDLLTIDCVDDEMIIVLQEIKPPSTKLKSPMPEAENTSWAQSNVMATKPAVEVKEDKVPDSNIQEDKKVGTLACFTLHCVL